MPSWAQVVIALFFPVFLVFATETGHLQSVYRTFEFTFKNIGVVLFDIFIVGAIFVILSMLTKKLWISAVICSAVFYIFSCIEYYKYNISGSHFLISDLALTRNVTDVALFADLKFNLVLFVIALLLAAYVFALWLFDIDVSMERFIRYAGSLGVFVMMASAIATPYFYTVCSAFGVDSEYTKNNFQENERFSKNSLTANLTVNVNQLINSKPHRPQDYSQNRVDELIDQQTNTGNNSDNAQTVVSKPVNVVMIMSESYADFRDFLANYPDSGEAVPDGTYDAWDEVIKKSATGMCVVPTFGGGTVRTEFELIFGLPIEALGNPTVPLSLFDKGVEYSSIPSLYRDHGYNTTYMHPFSPEFYERVDYYGGFGFDKLMFKEEMSAYLSPEILRMEQSEGIEPAGYYHDFISDATVYNDALTRMKYTDGADYIHITTMQNHMPYGEDEEINYFSGLENSGEALRDFIAQLENFDEPVIVFYVGDHYPFFSDQDNVYDRLGIYADNCELLYEQRYIVWNNYGMEFEQQPLLSAFYLPCLIAQKTGVSDSFLGTILSQKEECPIYSSVIATEGNEVLNLLAYDRISGDRFSE